MYLFKPFYGHKKDNATNGTYYIPYTYWYSLLKSINDFLQNVVYFIQTIVKI